MLAPWMDTLGSGIARRSSAVMSDSRFARSDFYNKTVRPTGTFHSATAALDYAANYRGFIAVGRRLGTDDFDSKSIETLQVLVPHLVTALRVRHQLDEGELHARSVYAMLDRLDVGIVLTDVSARPRFANARAEAIAAETGTYSVSARAELPPPSRQRPGHFGAPSQPRQPSPPKADPERHKRHDRAVRNIGHADPRRPFRAPPYAPR